jgi:hypothetical protein
MPRTWRTPAPLLGTALCAAVILNAAPPLTVIQDVLYKANGTRFDGVAQISWKSFQAADGSEIPQHTISVRVSNGALRVQLTPTTNALKSATYTVKFNSEGRTQFTEYWAVPPSAAPLKLRDVRISAPGPDNIEEGGAPVDIGEVIGLRTELDLRPARGASYTPSRAAVINSSGAIDSALGEPTDCIRVDGSTVPCQFVVFVDAETPSGTVNGVNTVFTLSSTPSPPSSLTLFRNGILQRVGVDYTLSGDSITFTSVSIPGPGDILQVSYRR